MSCQSGRRLRWCLVVVVAAALVALASTGCGRRTILFVDFDGAVAETILGIRAELTHLGEMITLEWEPNPGDDSISLPNSLTMRIRGATDGADMTVTLFAVGASGDLATGTQTLPTRLGEVVYYSITLVALPVCGNGVAEEGETCDGVDLGGEDCASLGMGFVGGTLACDMGCAFDTTGCAGADLCGNGTLDAGELCDDGSSNSDTAPDACRTTCIPAGCGDGVGDTGEACDGTDLQGADCGSLGLGFNGGVLACEGGCAFDTTGCSMSCGNGVADAGEPCDGVDLDGQTCATVGPFAGGTLACLPMCAGFDTSGCAAPPTVPALQAPLNDSDLGTVFIAGTMRPVFEWGPSTVAGGGTIDYELQFGTDPAFGAGTTTVPTVATTFQPASDLPVSASAPVGDRYYWRVRACVGAACSAYSATWWVNLGRSARDLNGDGYADVAVGATGNDAGGLGAGRAYVFMGAATLDTTADGTPTGIAAGDFFGASIARGGDVNGDGFGDLVVGAPLADAGGMDAGQAYVFLGGAGATFDATPDVTLTGLAAGDQFGAAVAFAGDVNGDGFSDVIVGAPHDATGGADSGRVYLFFGGDPMDPGVDLVLTGEGPDDFFGTSVAGLGDSNRDGFADWVVGAPQFGVNPGRAYVHFGGTSPDSSPDGSLDGVVSNDRFGISVAGAGDFNGDGFRDVIVGAEYSPGGVASGSAYLFLGGVGATFDAISDLELSGGMTDDRFGHAVAGIGDANGDGYDDIVIGAYFAGFPNAGSASVFLGGALLSSAADGTLLGVAMNDQLGSSVGGAGDVNGDGLADVVVGAPNADIPASNAGAAYVYFGNGGTTFSTSADVTLTGVAASDQFGIAVAAQSGNPTGARVAALSRGRRRRASRSATLVGESSARV